MVAKGYSVDDGVWRHMWYFALWKLDIVNSRAHTRSGSYEADIIGRLDDCVEAGRSEYGPDFCVVKFAIGVITGDTR